ncbi:MAG: amidohydrolase family protein, partial [Phaeodactylibacter sp.]|nr:amidohydrolase family protein [Phaeodactylibacter sp.]
DPLACYYAAVTRKRADDGSVFYPEQCMTREEALYAYTLGNAYAAFEEDVKGSLEKGKVADITVLSNNLISCPEEAILQADVLMTMVDGKVKFRSDKLK